jgi:hypothetical protein
MVLFSGEGSRLVRGTCSPFPAKEREPDNVWVLITQTAAFSPERTVAFPSTWTLCMALHKPINELSPLSVDSKGARGELGKNDLGARYGFGSSPFPFSGTLVSP